MLSKRILVLMFVVAFLLVGCFPSVTPPVTENQAPTITSTAITTATVGVAYTYDVNATDPDGDTLTYSLDVKPSGMIINSVTGVIFWTPIAEGVYTVVVKASDGVLSDTQGFTIVVSKPTVPPINQKPVINSYPITTAIVGETYTYDVNAFDPDSDILTYSVIDVKPIGMTINSANGFIWWIPTSTQIGDNLITVMVSDGTLSDTQSFIVKVSEPEPEPEPEPKLTKIEVDPKVMDLIVGGFETFEVTAHYDNDTTNIVTFKCLYGTSNHNIAYVAYGIDKVNTLAVGTATIFISYTQLNFLTGEEITKTDTIEVTVRKVPPVIDGVLSPGEWDGATEIPVGDSVEIFVDMGIVRILATTDYLYVAFDVKDSTDARLAQNIHGNDQTSINVNPSATEPWGHPWDIIFEIGADPNAWDGTSSGQTDGWETNWEINGVQQLSLPGDLDTMTLYSGGNRISEWKVPLASIAPSVGDVLPIGGAIDVGDGNSYMYPSGLEWADVSTCEDITVLY